jgi:hypothetical protein
MLASSSNDPSDPSRFLCSWVRDARPLAIESADSILSALDGRLEEAMVCVGDTLPEYRVCPIRSCSSDARAARDGFREAFAIADPTRQICRERECTIDDGKGLYSITLRFKVFQEISDDANVRIAIFLFS